MTELFDDEERWNVLGDDLGITFLSVGVVLVVDALTSGCTTGNLPALCTGLSFAFAERVLAALDRDACRDADWYRDLAHTIHHDRAQTEQALETALERFWLESTISDAPEELHLCRKRKIVGGLDQDWLDPEAEQSESGHGWIH